MHLINAIREHFARQAYARAAIQYEDYQRQAADGGWRFHIAYNLLLKMEVAGRRFDHAVRRSLRA